MKLLLSLFLFIAIASGCEQIVVDDRENSAKTLQEQLAEIRSIVAADTCSGADTCSFLAYGSKACGGPQGYLLFSNQINVEALTKKVEQYNKAEDAYNKKFGIISDCMYATPPEKLECVNGTCVQVE